MPKISRAILNVTHIQAPYQQLINIVQLLSPSLRCCSSPLYVQSSTGDTVIVDLGLLRQEKVEQKCQCMATGYPDDI